MSNRIRLILEEVSNGHVYYGKTAMNNLTILCTQNVLNFRPPENWNKMSRLERLKIVAKSLPPNWKLTVFSEPKKCRKSKSHIHALRSGTEQFKMQIKKNEAPKKEAKKLE